MKQKQRISIVYHRIDFDGICSYAVIKRYLETVNTAADVVVTPVPYTHGDPVPALGNPDLVYVADICLPHEMMFDLMSRHRLVWIDHHATNIEAAAEHGYGNAPGLRMVGRGACELCWKYLFHMSRTPDIVKYLSAYDVFDKKRFDWEDVVLPIQYGMRNRISLDAEKFCSLFQEYIDDCFDVLQEGKAILNYIRSTGRISCQAYGFEVSLAGEKALCLLTASFGSIPMEETANEHGCRIVLCVNRLGADRYKVSAYAPSGETPVHLGNYFRDNYGGGGHAGAAGCVIDEKAFLRLLNENIL